MVNCVEIKYLRKMFFIVLLLSVCSCSDKIPVQKTPILQETKIQSEVSTVDTVEAVSQSTDLSSFEKEVAGIKAGMDSNNVREILGAPNSISVENDYRDSESKFIIWHYKYFDVLLGNSDYVGAIQINKKGIQTSRGISIGDSKERVIEIYGQPTIEYENTISYLNSDDDMNDKVLEFTFNNNKIINIYIGRFYD